MTSRQRAYARVVQRAYFLELLGEVVYGHLDARAPRRSSWRAFAATEARMQTLLTQELARLHVGMSPRHRQLVRWLSHASGWLGARRLAWLVRRVVAQRRYSRWAAQYGTENPVLWQTLVQHEDAQRAHFNGRMR